MCQIAPTAYFHLFALHCRFSHMLMISAVSVTMRYGASKTLLPLAA